MEPKSRYKNTHGRAAVLIWAAILLLSLSCNLPLLALGEGKKPSNLEESLAESGLLNVDQISITDDQVVISYQVLPEDDPEVMMTGWFNALLAAAEAEPNVDLYILEISSGGKPYLEIRADALDVQGLAAEELSLDLFLERLEIIDQRPLAERVNGALIALGLNIIEVKQDRSTLMVEYFPDPAPDQLSLLEEWWSIFTAVADQEPDLETIQIRAVMPDGSAFVVESRLEDLQVYLQMEITPFQYLAGLEIREEPVELEE